MATINWQMLSSNQTGLIFMCPNQCYEGVADEFQYDDGGDQYHWSYTSLRLLDEHRSETWLEDHIEEDDQTRSLNGDLVLSDVPINT